MSYRILCFSLVCLFLLYGFSSSSILNIPTEYSTISNALENIQECDTILLDTGYYAGEGFRDIFFNTTGLDDLCFTIMSNSSQANTIIDLENNTFLELVDSTWKSEIKVNRFLFGIEINNISFINGDTVIKTNSVVELLVKHCEFENNDVGISVTYPGFGFVDSSIFDNNNIGVQISVSEFFSIHNSLFIANYYGVYVSNSFGPVLRNNIFTYNTTGLLALGGSVSIEKNNVVNNIIGIAGDANIYYCNNVYQNINNYVDISDQTGLNGNISEEPFFCDTTFQTISVGSVSPLLPENNSCGVNIGNVPIGCYCGDVNASGDIGISDITYFVAYMFNNGSPPIPLEAGEINGDGTIGISDLTFEVDYLFRGGPHPACGLYSF